jgi:DnaJ-domain-containing protein 1
MCMVRRKPSSSIIPGKCKGVSGGPCTREEKTSHAMKMLQVVLQRAKMCHHFYGKSVSFVELGLTRLMAVLGNQLNSGDGDDDDDEDAGGSDASVVKVVHVAVSGNFETFCASAVVLGKELMMKKHFATEQRFVAAARDEMRYAVVQGVHTSLNSILSEMISINPEFYGLLMRNLNAIGDTMTDVTVSAPYVQHFLETLSAGLGDFSLVTKASATFLCNSDGIVDSATKTAACLIRSNPGAVTQYLTPVLQNIGGAKLATLASGLKFGNIVTGAVLVYDIVPIVRSLLDRTISAKEAAAQASSKLAMFAAAAAGTGVGGGVGGAMGALVGLPRAGAVIGGALGGFFARKAVRAAIDQFFRYFFGMTVDARLNEAYEFLGVTPGTPMAQIKKKYYMLAKKYHPDKGGDPESFTKLATYLSAIAADQSVKTDEVLFDFSVKMQDVFRDIYEKVTDRDKSDL